MMSRRDAAIALDIPLEMATKHGIPTRLDESGLAALQADPPPWLLQSRANREGKRPVWVHLSCTVCGRTEAARPKKWWPDFDFVFCDNHPPRDLPAVPAGRVRCEYEQVAGRLTGVVDEPGR